MSCMFFSSLQLLGLLACPLQRFYRPALSSRLLSSLLPLPFPSLPFPFAPLVSACFPGEIVLLRGPKGHINTRILISSMVSNILYIVYKYEDPKNYGFWNPLALGKGALCLCASLLLCGVQGPFGEMLGARVNLNS